MSQTSIDELLAGLEKERMAILKGTYETLASVASTRDSLLTRTPKLSPAEAQMVLERITRNQRLLSSAIRGVQAALGRIADIDRAHTRLGTYRPDGTRSDVADASGRLVHRA